MLAVPKISKEEALKYHEKGKIRVVASKPLRGPKDLSTAYTPGVAHPCLEIEKNPDSAYDYTSKSNLVAVISNGTAVLGLGNIGALASKPVMEGKSVLFKSFANIDSIDIEVNETDVDKFVNTVKAIADSFGGINLEDIKAPECFEIEERLKAETNIPVMHDDQHGTAIISAAAMLNAVELTNRDLSKMKTVIVGAGAAAIACAKIYKELGLKDITLVDSKGVVSTKRDDLNKYKQEFAKDTEATTLAQAIDGADMVLGLSKPKMISTDMIKSMANEPIIFTLSNPIPEIMPEDVMSVRDDAIIATGRSDYFNQVNNVLGFPFIFRGALDVRATHINEKMKMAAAKALAQLAKEDVPANIKEMYGQDLKFSKEYVIPTPFDSRVVEYVAPAVAQAAMESGVSRVEIDIDEYKEYCKTLHLNSN
jgi:malate dehydrogenase (oxaloacetate-decarboxylating)(NADP+)